MWAKYFCKPTTWKLWSCLEHRDLWETAKIGVSLKKEIWVLFRAPFFLGKGYGVTTYFFFIQKKKKKKKKTKKNFTWLNCTILIDWIRKYMFEKLKITWLWVLVTIYQKYMAFCPSYILSKKRKRKRKRKKKQRQGLDLPIQKN